MLGWIGHARWHFALTMALANVVGSLLGTRLAIRHGAHLVRVVFIAVVSVPIIKSAADAFFR